MPHGAAAGAGRRDDGVVVRPRRHADRDRNGAIGAGVLLAGRAGRSRRSREVGVPEAGGGRTGASGDARRPLPAPDRAGCDARVAPDVPLFPGRGERPLCCRRRAGRGRRGRPAGPDDWHPVRACVAPVLQAVRREVRGLRGQAGVSRVRGGRTDHLELLIREYRALAKRQRPRPRRRPARTARAHA